MKRFMLATNMLALLAIVGLSLSPDGANAKDPGIKEIMGKLHKGANAPLGVLKRDLQSDEPPWPEIQKVSREFLILGAALGKNPPPKGDKDSWAKFARQYYDNAKALDDAAQKKDKPGALAAQARIAGSCNACHNAHRAN
jgi:hypothetical protein